MPQLTFMQNMADKASRLLPSSFSEIVEETTSEVLTSPDYENIMFICDQTNQRTENAKDVVLAIRRRIEAPNPKVQYFTVILLDALIKNCYEELHNQVADSPALQNCLVQIAVRTPVRDGEFEAKKAALQLILNMSYWFIGATEDKTKMLSKLADEVRAETTPLAFEDIEADAAYQLKRAPPRAQKQNTTRRAVNATAASGGAAGTAARRPSSATQHQRVVNAIPVLQYTGDEISGMLDACMLLSETINSAAEEKRSVIGDELVSAIAVQVRKDHRKLAIILSSGAQMDNLDVLLSVSDSQTAIIQRLAALVQQQGQQLRDVANMGADEDDNDLHAGNATAPPRQITRSSPTTALTAADIAATAPSSSAAGFTSEAQYDSKTTTAKRGARPRQGYGDEVGEEMGDSTTESSPPSVPQAQLPSGASNHATTYSPTGSPSSPAARKGDQKGNEQELDDFFGGNTAAAAPSSSSAAPQGDHNTIYTGTASSSAATTEASMNEAQQRHAAPAPYQIANPSQPIPNNDFFESNNAPSSNVAPANVGAINGGEEKDEFDAFLNSRMPQ